MHTVTEVYVVKPYSLIVTFVNGVRREIDLEPELFGEMFQPLRDPALFGQVMVDPSLGTIRWPNGADLSPEFLYDGANPDGDG